MTRVQMFDYEIDSLRMEEAVAQIVEWIAQDKHSCRIVVTPNVNHTVLLQKHMGLQAVYRDADLVLADGFPIIVAAKLLNRWLPERVAGSELVPNLFSASSQKHPQTAYLLGAAPGVAEQAAVAIHERYRFVQVVGAYSPPMGFEMDQAENASIVEKINDVKPDLLCVGLGAPKQELWLHRHREQLNVKVGLCIGATIDFMAGEKAQAPIWMRRSGLEWIHRILSEPKRLTGRYARDATVFPRLVWREWRRSG